MNLIYKLYCRTFQRVLWLALPLLPYRDPETLDSVRQLPEVLRSRGVDRVLLVTDRQLRARGLTAPLEALLPEAGIGCTVYDGTASNPTVDNVEEARELYLREGCQALVAFGGGAVIHGAGDARLRQQGLQ